MRTRSIGSLQVSVVGLGCNNFGGRIDADAHRRRRARRPRRRHHLLRHRRHLRRHQERGVPRPRPAGRDRDDDRARHQVRDAGRRRARRGPSPTTCAAALEPTACAASAPTTSTSTSCTPPTPRRPSPTPWAPSTTAYGPGKVREIGCSNFSRGADARRRGARRPNGTARFVSVQNQYSLLHRDPERDVLPECERAGLAFLPYFPLASGVLTGKYRPASQPPPGARAWPGRPQNDQGPLADDKLAVVERLPRSPRPRAHHGRARHRLDRWPIRPVASVIAGATSAAQVDANVAAADWALDDGDLAEIDALVPRPPEPGPPAPRRSGAGRRHHAAGAHRVDEGGVVALGLVGVGDREARHGVVEHAAASGVAGDVRPPPRSGRGPGPAPTHTTWRSRRGPGDARRWGSTVPFMSRSWRT